jgi:Galactose oxidase, central domain
MAGRAFLLLISTAAIFLQACGGTGSGTTPPPPTVTANHFSVTAPSTSSSGLVVQVTVTALSASNSAATNYTGTVHLTSSDTRAVLPADSVLTNGTGTFAVTLFTASVQTVTATDTGMASITGVSSPITVTAAQFGSVGSMSTGRELHTATLLSDGKVLITGGSDGSTALATAELFDPSTGNFTATGSLATARQESTATLLGNGKVLVSGGFGANGQALASADLYDPTQGTFSPSGSMSTQRALHTATLLKDGRVLIAGGSQSASSTQTTATAELFDPATGAFSATGSMVSTRANQVATLLNNGTVLVAGGQATDGSILSTAEIFDVTTASFAATGNMSSVRESFTAALLADGNVLVAGGDAVTSTYSSAEIFDSSNGTFAMTGPMTIPRQWHTATALDNGTVLVVGGDQLIFVGGSTRAGVLPESTATTEFFDPGGKTFTAGNDLVQDRAKHTATLLNDGSILVTGGRRSRIMGTVPLSSVLAGAEVLK